MKNLAAQKQSSSSKGSPKALLLDSFVLFYEELPEEAPKTQTSSRIKRNRKS